MKNPGSIRILAAGFVGMLVVSACGPAPSGGAPATAEAPAKKVYYADARTWPSQPDLLKRFTKGKFYIPIQDDGLVAVIDPDKPGYVVKLIKVAAAQPHHPWTAPGMRYVFVNHQSEGKGDHNVMTVIDTFTDEVVTEMKTDFDDPFHCSFSPTNADLMLCGDLNPKGGYVYFIDSGKKTVLSKLKTNGTVARDVIQTQDGKYAFVGHQGKGDIDVIDIGEKKIVKTIACDRCARLKATPDGKWLFASSPPNDFTAIIDMAKQEIVNKITFDKKSGPGNINYADGGKVAMIGLGAAGKLALVDVEKQTLTVILTSGKGTNAAYAHPLGDPVAISTNDSTDDWYTIVDPVAGKVITAKLEAGGKGTHNVHWSADGRYAVGSDRLGDTVTLFRWDSAAKKLEKVASIKVGFGANGVQWAPYFCGAPEITTKNVATLKNIAPKGAGGECP
ncbi:MAG: hypothetical protein AAB295_02705 [Chloroflexota bacterium]